VVGHPCRQIRNRSWPGDRNGQSQNTETVASEYREVGRTGGSPSSLRTSGHSRPGMWTAAAKGVSAVSDNDMRGRSGWHQAPQPLASWSSNAPDEVTELTARSTCSTMKT